MCSFYSREGVRQLKEKKKKKTLRKINDMSDSDK